MARLFSNLEESIGRGDWEAVAAAEAVQPEVAPDDEQELCHLIAEAERLQRLIANYMAQVHHDLEMAPQVRRAAAAYTRGDATR